MDALSDQLAAAQRPRWLIRLAASLGRPKRPSPDPRDLEPAVAAKELLAWAKDDGRWAAIGRAPHDWASLLNDVDVAWLRLGPKLRTVVSVDAQLAALRDARAGGKLHDSARQSVEEAALHLANALGASGAMVAAADDLFDAAQHSSSPASLNEETRWRLALFASVTEAHGHDWAVISGRVKRSLESTRAQRLDESLRTVYRALDAPPDRGHSIVWLVIDHASAWVQPQDSPVQLFDGDWLLAVLRDWTGPRDGVPPELAADPQKLPGAWNRADEDADPKEQLPIAFARIDLGEGPTAGARERARDTLELLVARASARRHGTTWKIRDDVMHFVDGDVIYETMGPIGDPDIYSRIGRRTIIHDPTAKTIMDEAQRLRAHIPVTGGRLHDALQLSKWLTEARDSPPPARLVLSGRIIEQVANWADLSPRELIEDHLSWSWARNAIAEDLAEAGWQSVMRLPAAPLASSSAQADDALVVRRAIINEADGELRIRSCAVLPHLDWLVKQYPAGTETGDYLRVIKKRTATGLAVANWIDELRGELRIRNARAVRTRNALVHGGPLVAAVVDSVVGVFDSLGSQGLEWVIEGLATGRALPELFAEHRRRHSEAVCRLREDGEPQTEPHTVLTDLIKGP